MNFALVSTLLRAPGEVARTCLERRRLSQLAVVSLALIGAGGALFGGVVGSYRGELQIVYSAIKLPLACLATLVACTPAYYAFANAFGHGWSMRSVSALTLAAIARSALVLCAAAPAIWLLIDVGAGYHTSALWASLAYGAAGLAALGVLFRALPGGSSRLGAALVVVSLLCVVGGQNAWLLRPYLGRPSQDEIPFLRSPDGVFAERVWTSGRSSFGHFDEEQGPGPRHEVTP